MGATPEMIAAAWAAWHSRHGGKLRRGPAFVEAINAALAAMRHGLPDFSDWGSAREMLTRLGEDAGASDETSAKLSALADWIEQFGPDALASVKEKP